MESNRSNETRHSVASLYLILSLILAGLTLMIQLYQQILYQHHPPFFDSVSYFDRVYDVVSLRRDVGLGAALNNAIFTSSTTCFPYLLAIPASFVTGPTRLIGVWIELFYFTIFWLSFAEYLRRVQKFSHSRILYCLASALLISALYRFNSGLSDLRVDLPMACLYGAIACWWLIGRAFGQWNSFFIVGLLAGIACLTRAIAPVYLVCGFGPLIILDAIGLIRQPQLLLNAGSADLEVTRQRTRTFMRFLVEVAVSAAVAGIVSIWFFVIHFDYLYFYYAVWNTDANASVSFLRASKHLLLAVKSLGIVFLVFVASVLFMSGWAKLIDRRVIAKPKLFNRDDLLRLTWLGLAPIFLLIAKRADLNPFVTLPGAIGLFMASIVCLSPAIEGVRGVYPHRLKVILMTLVMLALGIGWFNHQFISRESLQAHRQIVSLIREDALQNRMNSVGYGANLITSLSSSSLESIFQYECDSQYVDGETVLVDGINFSVCSKLMNPSKANWDLLPGENSTQKIHWLEQFAVQNIDYLVTLTRDSIPVVQQQLRHDYSMQFATEILDSYEKSGNWEQLGKSFKLSPGISVKVMRNCSNLSRLSKGNVQSNVR